MSLLGDSVSLSLTTSPITFWCPPNTLKANATSFQPISPTTSRTRTNPLRLQNTKDVMMARLASPRLSEQFPREDDGVTLSLQKFLVV